MKNFKRNAMLVCFCAAVGTGALGVRYGFLSAEAEENYNFSKDNFYVRGASVRLVEDEFGPGIKFHVVMDKSVYASLPSGTKTGTVVLPEALLPEGTTLTKDTASAETRETTALWFENTDGKMESVVYVYDIPEDYYGQDIAVAGYVVADDGTAYHSETAAVSMAWIAKGEYNDEASTNYKKDSLEDYFTFSIVYGEAEPQEVIYGDKLTAPTAPDAADEYSWFAGWSNKDGTLLWDFENDVVTGNMTLYPKFERVEKPQLSMSKDGTALVVQWQEQSGADTYSVSVNGVEAAASGLEYRVDSYDATQDYRITVTASKTGATSQSTTLFLDHRGYQYDSSYEAYPVAVFDSTQYADTMDQVPFEPTNLALSDATFEATTSGFKVNATGVSGSSQPNKKSGFFYRFPLALPQEAKLLTFNFDLSAFGVSQYGNTYIGLSDDNGVNYNVSKFSKLSDGSETHDGAYISTYNKKTATFIVNLKDFYAANPTAGKITGLSFGQNKSTTITLKYITYSNVLGKLSAPSIKTVYGENGVAVSWDAVANADGYEVLLDGSACTDYNNGTSFTLTSSGVLSVTAKSSTADYGDSAPAEIFIDSSYKKARGDGYYYLSDFNNAGVATMFEGSNVSWNSGGTCGAATYEYTSQNTGSNKDIETKGISVRMPGTYGSVKYNLPEKFDLSGVQSLEFVLRQNGNAQRGINVSLKLTCGDKIYTISGKMTNIKKAEGAGDLWSSNLKNPLSFAVNCAHVGFAVQDYLSDIEETLGGTEIDGIIICVQTKAQNSDGTYDVVILDEIFYSKVSEPSTEEENEA